MQKVDRLGWAAGFVAQPVGEPIGVRVRHNDDLALAQEMFQIRSEQIVETSSPYVTELLSVIIAKKSQRRGTRNMNVLYHGHTPMVRSENLDEFKEGARYLWDLVAMSSSRDCIFARGSVLELKGKSVAILATDGETNKSVYDSLRAKSHPFLIQRLFGINSQGALLNSEIMVRASSQTELYPDQIVMFVPSTNEKVNLLERDVSKAQFMQSLFLATVSGYPERHLKKLSSLVKSSECSFCYWDGTGDPSDLIEA